MKRTLISLFSLLGLAMAVTSCQKDESVAKFSASMETCVSQDGKTVLNGTGLEWTADDQIAVYGSTGSQAIYTANPITPATSAEFVLVSGETGAAPYSAIYPASIALAANSVNIPATQTSVDGSLTQFPMYAQSETENLAFKNLCGALKITLTGEANVASIAVTTDQIMNGDYTVAMSGDAPTLTYVNNGTTTTTLVCENAQNIANGASFYMALPHNMYNSLQFVITADDGSVCTKTTNANFTGLNIYRSQVSEIVLNNLDFEPATDVPTGALNGLFSVSATKQVYFSMGNLQYDGANSIWQFAANQYDIIASANANPTATSLIDLFGWGTSSFNGKNPWMTSTVSTDYGYGNNRNITNTQYDWGKRNAIVNGGNEAGMWRTLTTQEWSYLLNTRTDAAAKRGIATVNGVYGVVILPDEFTLPAGLTFNAGYSKTALWSHNVYTETEWAQMEAAGAAFLPCNGCRQGENFLLEETAHYWSVSSASADKAAAFYFRSNDILPVYQEQKFHGHAVRLVQDAE